MPPSSFSFLPTDPTSHPVDPSHSSHLPSNPSPSSSYAIDPSLAALSSSYPQSSSSPLVTPSGPAPFDQAVAGPGPSSLAHGGALYDLSVVAEEQLYPYLGGGGGGEFELPTPPAEFSSNGGGGSRKGKGKGKEVAKARPKGKGKKVTIQEDDIPVHAEDDGRFSSSRGGRGEKRARSSSFGSSSHGSGEDYDQHEEDDEEDGFSDSQASLSGSEGVSPQPSSRAPASALQPHPISRTRKSRAITVAQKILKAGGVEKAAGKRMRVRGVTPALGSGNAKRGVVLPLLPEVYKEAGRLGEGREGEAEELKKEIERAKDPAFANGLLESLSSNQDYYDAAYRALEQELLKAQVEESVLKNVQTIVIERRNEIRHLQDMAAEGREMVFSPPPNKEQN